VDDRPIVWDAANRKHLGSGHPERNISIGEIEEALHDISRIETELRDRQANQMIGPDRGWQMAGGDLDR